ncbi:hypothetical protein ACFY1P_08105 [Streptomyces sp. NPDC001407]|uniref:hypothetical protein n=1 Tax=Streptomyces sp. NPDC001407 TaxID=3364573 RepID=UPI0036A92F6B
MKNIDWKVDQVVSASDMTQGVKEWNDILGNPPRMLASDAATDRVMGDQVNPISWKSFDQYGGWTSFESGGGKRAFKVPVTGYYLICFMNTYDKPAEGGSKILQQKLTVADTAQGSGKRVIAETFSSSSRSGRFGCSSMAIERLEKGKWLMMDLDAPWVGKENWWSWARYDGEFNGYLSACLVSLN